MTESSPLLLPKPFLGVTNSALGRTWIERCDTAQGAIALAIAQTHGLPDVLSRVLAGRGVGIHDTEGFLNPRLRDLMPDPHVLTDMEAAASRLADAVLRNEKVAIFGDYDVDGACSAALLAEYLRACGLEYAIHIPDRITEGYGPNVDAIRALKQQGADILVTVDCGTASIEPLAEAKRLGLDPVVLDHHQAPEQLPEALAVVNPNRQDDLSGLGHLCAAGVVFLFLVALNRALRSSGFFQGRAEPDLMGSLDLVALATVADVVPLQGLNRAFVTRGLQVMRQRENTGLKALFDAAGLNQAPTPYHLGFVLGPRINAGGRIGDAALGAKLLATEDELEAARIAVLLDKLNRERKAIEKEMLEEAIAEADRLIDQDPDLPILLVGSERWHKGIVGLVASRLVERFGRPACVIAWEGPDQGTGSLRSVSGVDIGAAVRAGVGEGLLVKGGGHTMAAGLTVKRERLGALTARLREMLRDPASAARAQAGLDFDGALTPAAVTDDLIDLLERAGPYGQGNPQPRFAFPAHRIKYSKVMGEAHIRCTLEAGDGSRLDAVAFRAVGQPLGELLLSSSGLPLHLAGSVRRESWGGRERIELQIEDAADPRRQG